LPAILIEGETLDTGGHEDPLRDDAEMGKSKRGPRGAFLGALLGSACGFLLMPAHVNWRATDADVLSEMFCIMGGAGIGGILGATIGWLDRRV
jgi:hypothetical protein